MKRTWPPPHIIFVGLESNQQGQAASQEQASSSWPVIFHGVLSFGASAARDERSKVKNAAMIAVNGRKDWRVIVIGTEFYVCEIIATSEFVVALKAAFAFDFRPSLSRVGALDL